jgi:hypothetical protein
VCRLTVKHGVWAATTVFCESRDGFDDQTVRLMHKIVLPHPTRRCPARIDAVFNENMFQRQGADTEPQQRGLTFELDVFCSHCKTTATEMGCGQ